MDILKKSGPKASKKDARPLFLPDLPQEILEKIFGELNVVEQCWVSRLNKRLERVVHGIWSRLHFDSINITDSLMQSLSDTELEQFLVNTQNCVKAFEFHDNCPRMHSIINANQFPNVESCEYWIDRRELVEDSPSDADVLACVRAFPNLKKLKLYNCNVTGKYITEFQHLTDLTFDNCRNFESQYLYDIFAKLRLKTFGGIGNIGSVRCSLRHIEMCPTLTELHIAQYMPYDEYVMHLPHIKTVIVYAREVSFSMAVRAGFPSDSLTFTTNPDFRILSIEATSNVKPDGRQTKLYRTLLSIFPTFPDVEEIHMCSYEMSGYQTLLDVIRRCRNLRILNLCGSTGFDVTFIYRAMEILTNQAWRTWPLQLYLLETNINIGDLRKDVFYNENRNYLVIDGTKRLKGNTNKLFNYIKFTLVKK